MQHTICGSPDPLKTAHPLLLAPILPPLALPKVSMLVSHYHSGYDERKGGPRVEGESPESTQWGRFVITLTSIDWGRYGTHAARVLTYPTGVLLLCNIVAL